MYEMIGIPKYFLVKLQVLLILAEIINNQLIVKCFMYDVVVGALFI